MKDRDKRPIDKKTPVLIFKEIVTSSLFIFSILLVAFTIGIMLLIFLAEKKDNPNMQNIFDAVWYTVVTITTVGYGDISPSSAFGRIMAFILILLGVGIFGAISGKITSFLFDRQQKRDRGLVKMQKLKNNFLILG